MFDTNTCPTFNTTKSAILTSETFSVSSPVTASSAMSSSVSAVTSIRPALTTQTKFNSSAIKNYFIHENLLTAYISYSFCMWIQFSV